MNADAIELPMVAAKNAFYILIKSQTSWLSDA